MPDVFLLHLASRDSLCTRAEHRLCTLLTGTPITAHPNLVHNFHACAEEIVRQVYVQTFLPTTTVDDKPPPPLAQPDMNGATQQHNTSPSTGTLEDLYPHDPPGFVPGRRKPAPTPAYSPHQANSASNGHASSQHLAARGGKHNPNVKCPCGKETYADAKELLVCHTCKMVSRHTLQHASHMGYDMAKFTAVQRAAHMCEQCRLDHADPFWKQFPEVRPGTDPRSGWILPLTWLKRQVIT